VLSLLQVGRRLNRPTVFFIAEASNIPRGRNMILDQLRMRFPDRSTLPVLWVDSDIWIPPFAEQSITDAIEWGDSHHANVVANYLMANGQTVLMNDRTTQGRHFTPEEWQALPDYAEVGITGFGFLYVEQPLAYTFYADRIGEDIHFWWDNPEIRIHVAKRITIGHRKSVMLSDASPIPGDRLPSTLKTATLA